jgi:uncharacterized protein YukE
MAVKQEVPEFAMPSNPADKQKLRIMLEEMTHAMRRADDEKESIKAIAKEIKEQFTIAPKYATKLAKAMYNHNFDEIEAEHSEFRTLYEEIVSNSSSTEE